jgi:phosphohistidine phosphatase
VQVNLEDGKLLLVTEQRRLILMRHAKAEPFGSTDQARELTDRGRADAYAAGTHLAETRTLPDYVVVSPAARAAATWDAVAEASGVDAQINTVAGVYTGGPDVVLDELSLTPAEAGTVMFVGHNPAASFVCHLLDDGEGDPTALRGLLQGFPPGALAVFDVDVPWSDLGPETGTLVDFFVAG